jgi:hypothetical protein
MTQPLPLNEEEIAHGLIWDELSTGYDGYECPPARDRINRIRATIRERDAQVEQLQGLIRELHAAYINDGSLFPREELVAYEQRLNRAVNAALAAVRPLDPLGGQE